jgi:hypothetical protein
MEIELKVRPMPVRLWRSYCGYRRLFGRFASLRAAIALERLWQQSKP